MFFAYGDAELACLRARDKRLCEVIDKIGHVDRVVDTDLFSAVVHHIVGQQLSTKAQATIWKRMRERLFMTSLLSVLFPPTDLTKFLCDRPMPTCQIPLALKSMAWASAAASAMVAAIKRMASFFILPLPCLRTLVSVLFLFNKNSML